MMPRNIIVFLFQNLPPTHTIFIRRYKCENSFCLFKNPSITHDRLRLMHGRFLIHTVFPYSGCNNNYNVVYARL